MSGVSVLCPCLNEAQGLLALMARLGPVLEAFTSDNRQPAEIVFVDDGSSDATWSRMEALRLDSPHIVRTVRHPCRRGIAAAWSSGIAAARGEWVVALDADLQFPPEAIPHLWAELGRTGADVVQATRSTRRHDLRFVLSRGLNRTLNRLFHMSLHDNKSGFFLCRRDVLLELLQDAPRYRHWQCLVMVAAHHRGYRIHEVETPFRDRYAGRSAFGRVALVPTLAVALDLVRATRDYRVK